MEAATAEKLLEAFQILDLDGTKTLSKDFISKLMTEEGEPFTQDELEEMMAAAVDVSSGEIHYEYYINSLMVTYPCNIFGFAKLLLTVIHLLPGLTYVLIFRT